MADDGGSQPSKRRKWDVPSSGSAPAAAAPHTAAGIMNTSALMQAAPAMLMPGGAMVAGLGIPLSQLLNPVQPVAAAAPRPALSEEAMKAAQAAANALFSKYHPQAAAAAASKATTSQAPAPVAPSAFAAPNATVSPSTDKGEVQREVFINDAPTSVRVHLTKRHVQDEIQARTHTIIVTRGRYYPPGMALDPKEKPLHLHVKAGASAGPTEDDKQRAVANATAEIHKILQGAPLPRSTTPPAYGAPSYLHQPPYGAPPYGHPPPGGSTPPPYGLPSGGQPHVPPPMPAALIMHPGLPHAPPEFQLAEKIRGPGSSYLTHIARSSNTTLHVRGQGSGDAESPDPLHVLITGNSPHDVDVAKGLMMDLLKTTADQFRQAYPHMAHTVQQPSIAPAPPSLLGMHQQQQAPPHQQQPPHQPPQQHQQYAPPVGYAPPPPQQHQQYAQLAYGQPGPPPPQGPPQYAAPPGYYPPPGAPLHYPPPGMQQYPPPQQQHQQGAYGAPPPGGAPAPYPGSYPPPAGAPSAPSPGMYPPPGQGPYAQPPPGAAPPPGYAPPGQQGQGYPQQHPAPLAYPPAAAPPPGAYAPPGGAYYQPPAHQQQQQASQAAAATLPQQQQQQALPVKPTVAAAAAAALAQVASAPLTVMPAKADLEAERKRKFREARDGEQYRSPPPPDNPYAALFAQGRTQQNGPSAPPDQHGQQAQHHAPNSGGVPASAPPPTFAVPPPVNRPLANTAPAAGAQHAPGGSAGPGPVAAEAPNAAPVNVTGSLQGLLGYDADD